MVNTKESAVPVNWDKWFASKLPLRVLEAEICCITWLGNSLTQFHPYTRYWDEERTRLKWQSISNAVCVVPQEHRSDPRLGAYLTGLLSVWSCVLLEYPYFIDCVEHLVPKRRVHPLKLVKPTSPDDFADLLYTEKRLPLFF